MPLLVSDYQFHQAFLAVDMHISLPENVRCCIEHSEYECEHFCETCSELVCLECINGGHSRHNFKGLNDAFEKYKKEIAKYVQPMEIQAAKMKEVHEELEVRSGEISDQQEASKDGIHAAFRQLRKVLDARETELVNQLDQVAQNKQKSLTAQKDHVAATLTQLKNSLHFIRNSPRVGGKGDLLMMKAYTMKQLDELTTSFQLDNVEADIAFLPSTEVVPVCQNYGRVFSSALPDPSKCHVLGSGIVEAVIGEKSTAILQVVNFHGKPCKEPVQSLECGVVSEITGTISSCDVLGEQGESRGCYEISYDPTIKGRHQLYIKIGGQHVRGSPFIVKEKFPLMRFGTPILTICGVEGPWGVAVNQAGNIVVTEQGNDRVSVFSPCGRRLQSFGSQGQFNHPRGVAVDGEGNILVADCWNHRVQKLTADGKLLAAVGVQGNKAAQFSTPTSVAFNAGSGNIFVADKGNHRIQVLRSDLTFLKSFGKAGSSNGEFQEPLGIACDNTGKVYVADSGNHRIQVFTAEGKFLGKFLRKFGRHGRGRGELDRPVGVAIDASNMVYVSDFGNDRITLFTSEGRFVASFGKKGAGKGELNFPCGLAVDDSGVMYVCDDKNNRVQVF